MDDNKYTKLLKLQSAELTGSTPFCPEDQQIAEYFDGDLNEAERTVLERHLTDCRFCLARIGALERLEENRSNQRVPGAILATAKQIAHKVPARRLRLAPVWASAAVVVIALFTIISKNQEPVQEPGAGPSAVSSTGKNSRQLRSVNRDAMNLNVLIPAPGADTAAGMHPGLPIQWTEIPGNLHYDIYVLSYAGDVLWTERLKGTEWVLHESMHLAAGSKYYFRVEAQLPDGRTVSSKHVVFQVVELQ
jgi:hypothetical protein